MNVIACQFQVETACLISLFLLLYLVGITVLIYYCLLGNILDIRNYFNLILDCNNLEPPLNDTHLNAFWCDTVNKNLVGVGSCMTTDQKKKLLWGSKKSTPAEEVFVMIFYHFLYLTHY